MVLVGNDPDGNVPTFTVIDSPLNGKLSGTAPDLTYSPNAGYIGIDRFTFETNDGIISSSLATVSINITPVKKPTDNSTSGVLGFFRRIFKRPKTNP